MPERDFMFLYHDNKYHFYFVADRKWEGQVFDIVVMAGVRVGQPR